MKIATYRPPDDVHLFVLRRAVRFGHVTRRDVLEAFDRIGTTKATLAMDYAAAHWPRTLERTGKAVRLREEPEIPPEAQETQLIECLENGWLEFRHTGLRERELPVERIRWTAAAPQKSGALTEIVKAIVWQRPVRICYVGLRRGETARWRLIYPAGLERLGDQWRIVAQDLEAPGFPVRTFVLPRVFDAEASDATLPNDIVRQSGEDRLEAIPVQFDPRLTRDQRAALAHELRIQNDVVSLPRRGIFEYFRRFSDEPASADAVWPVIYRIEE
jgi:hypothetical protein